MKDKSTPQVLAIVGSARGDSNTLKAIKKLSPYKIYELLDLIDHEVEHYDYDQKTQDDFLNIIQKMITSDVIIFATPVYWYAMSGRMKVFFDRFSELISTHKKLGRALAGKKVLLIAQGSSPDIPPGFENPFRDTAHYFSMEFLGTKYLQLR